MATINTTPIFQKVYTKMKDGSLSPVTYWTVSDSVYMPDGTKLTDYLESLGSGSSIDLVNQDDTTDIDSAIATLGKTQFKNGQMLIIVNPQKETAGYVYDDGEWVAFSGSVSADTVMFSEDIICAGNYTQVGNVTKSQTGTTTIPAKNKSLKQVMNNIFTKELQPTVSNPGISISLTNAGQKEVGTKLVPSYSVSTTKGSYTYGPDTEVVWSNIQVSDVGGNTSTDLTGTFPQITVTDTLNYSISATGDHSDGVVAKTNLSNDSDPIQKINAKTGVKATSSSITGYRAYFYGLLNNDNTLTSDIIRSLTNGGKPSSTTKTLNARSGAVKFIVALPSASGYKVTHVDQVNGLSTNITDSVYMIGTIEVEGANGYSTTKSYNIWQFYPAKLDSNDIYEITIG